MSDSANRTPAQGPADSPNLFGSLQTEVAVEAAPVLQFIVDNIRVIAAVLAALVLATIGTGGYRWYAAKTLQEAQGELGMIIVTKAGKERLDALDAFVTRAPASMRNAALLEVARVAMEQKDTARATAAFARLAAEDTGATGMMATLARADVLVSEGKSAEALPDLDRLENTVPEPVRNVVRSAIVRAAEGAGNIERALAACDAIVASGAGAEVDFYRGKAAALKARLATKS